MRIKNVIFALVVTAIGACQKTNVQEIPFNPVTMDEVSIDAKFPPSTFELDFDSNGSALNGHIYVANGAGPHPTVILLHGFPGYEKNLDIGQAMRRAGFNVLFFHYRGAWGSEGNFSLTHVIEDTLAASAFVRSDTAVQKYRIDPEKISFVGHSMGGFAALAAGAKDKNVSCVAGLSPADYGIRGDMFTNDDARSGFAAYVNGEYLLGKGPLKGITGEGLLQEIDENQEAFSISKQADAYGGRSVFLTAGEKDTVLPPSIYHRALVDAFSAQKDVNLTHQLFASDHSYSWERIALSTSVVNWLDVNCR